MKTFNLLIFLLVTFYLKPTAAQTLEVFSPEVNRNSYAHTLHEKAYYGQGDNNFFSSYDGEVITNLVFPSRDGRNLRYHPHHNEMVVHAGNIYMVLHDIEHYREDVSETRRYFYRFNGTSFTSIPLPGKPVSNPMVFQDQIYIMVQVGAQVKLFNYNGATAIEIPASSLNPYRTHRLIVAGHYLYASGNDSGRLLLKRYNGTRIENLPSFICSLDIKIHHVAGTGHVYIDEDDFRLFHFNGTSILQVYMLYTSFTVWNDIGYFVEGYLDDYYAIFRHDGFRTTTIVLPDGARPLDIIVFQNELHITALIGDSDLWLYIYDGTSFRRSFLTSEISYPFFQFKRADQLMIVMNFEDRPATILAYNGRDFNSISGPVGNDKVSNYLTSTPCFHLWETFDYDSERIKKYSIAKETKNCPPLFSIIPDHVRRFERADLGLNGRYRDWCWTDIFWDWEITPECPFCPEPRFSASMADSKGKIAWEETFKEPFNIKIPLDDIQPYKLTLSSMTEKSTKNLFIIGDDLVSKGFSSIEMSMIPAKEFFYIKAETKDKKIVPFTMSLLNDKGETIWKEDFIAPINKEITAKVDKPGTTIMITSSEGIKKQENFNIKMNATPNPFHDKLDVGIQSFDNKEIPIALSIINLNGQVIYEKSILTPAMESINLSHQKSGIYILRMVSGNEVRTQLIKLER